MFVLSESRTELGKIAIGQEVIATLAGAAAMEGYGLVAWLPGGLPMAL